MEHQGMLERLDAIIQFATEIKEELEKGVEVTEVVKEAPKPVQEPKPVVKPEPNKPEEKVEKPAKEVTAEVTEEDLRVYFEEYSLAETKKFLKDRNVDFPVQAKKVGLIRFMLELASQGKFSLSFVHGEDETVEETIEEEVVETPVAEVAEEVSEEATEDEDSILEIIADYELKEMSEAELKEFLDSYKISYPKKTTKEALINIVALNIMNGTIEVEETEDEEPAEEEPAEEVAEVTEEESSAEREATEATVEKELRDLLNKDAKLLKKARKELGIFYKDDEDCSTCDCPKENVIDCYVDYRLGFIDDDGKVHEEMEHYFREGESYCCGAPLEGDELDTCTVCGTIYSIEE